MPERGREEIGGAGREALLRAGERDLVREKAVRHGQKGLEDDPHAGRRRDLPAEVLPGQIDGEVHASAGRGDGALPLFQGVGGRQAEDTRHGRRMPLSLRGRQRRPRAGSVEVDGLQGHTRHRRDHLDGQNGPRERRRPRPNRREIHLDDREKAQIQVHNGDDIRGKENGRRKEYPDEQDAHLGRRDRRRRREDKRRPVRGLRPKRRLLRLPLRRPGGLHTKLPRAADVQGDLRPRQMARLPIPLLQREPRQGRGCAEKAGIHRRNRRHDRAFGGRRQSLQALEGKPQDLRSVGEGRLPRLLPRGHELPLLRPAVWQIRQQIQKGDRRDALDGPRGQGERLGTEDIVQVTT